MASYDDTATVSGSVVSFSNGANDVPLKSCEVALPASLDGYSEIDVVSAGKNLVDGTNFTRGLPSTTIGASIDTITASTRYAYIGISVKGANYTISSVSNDTDYFWNILIYGYTNGVLSVYTNTAVNASKTVDFSGCDYIRLAIGTQSASYQVPTDLTEYGTIQLEVGSTASTYEPFVAPTTHTINLGRTIYGGQVDVVKGEGEETYGYIVFDGSDDEAWYAYTNYEGYSINISTMKVGTRQDGVCNQLTKSSTTAQGQTNAFWLGVNTRRFYVLGVYQSMGDTVEAFKSYLAENPLILVYPLDVQTDFTFSPVEINSRLGDNTFWSEQGNTELTYYKDGYGFTSVTVHKETPDGEPVVQTVKFHRIVYEGEADAVRGIGKVSIGESGAEYDPPETFTFEPISISTDEDENTLFATEGDSAITYRKAVE